MITDDFCKKFEIAIARGLHEHPDKRTNTITTDDIVFDPSNISLTKKFVNDNRYAVLRMYAITGGSGVYDLILLFGNKATSRYARSLHLMHCIPAAFDESNMAVDLEKREIVVRLE